MMTIIGINGNKVISRLDSPGFHISAGADPRDQNK
jgi:hypothetical protein